MQQAVVTTPKATLYQSVILKNKCFVGQSVSDELLSGWLRLQRMAEDKRCT